MKYKRAVLLLLCLCCQLMAAGQLWRVQVPFLYGAQGWQTSNWDPATENVLTKAQTLGVCDVAYTVTKRFTVDLSYQLEQWQFGYISVPDYLDRASINLPERNTVLSNLQLGSTVYTINAYEGLIFGQIKLGVAKNWWFQKWSLDLGMRYAFYHDKTLSGTSYAMVSKQRFYRVDRWSDYGAGSFQLSLKPNLFLSRRFSVGARLSWLLNNGVSHAVLIERMTGLNVPEERYLQEVNRLEHRVFIGIGLYYSNRLRKVPFPNE